MRPGNVATGPPSQETRSESTEDDVLGHELAAETRTYFRCTCGEKFSSEDGFLAHAEAYGGRR